jgi:hypothetical protein
MASGRDCSDRNEDYLQILEESRVLETESGRPASRGEQILAARLSMVLSLRGRLDWSVALRALLSRVEALDGHVGVRDAVAAALLESAAAMKPEGWFPPPPVRLRDGFAAADGKAREFLERFVATLESCAKATGYLERLICLARANNLLGEIEDFLLATRANDGLAEQESWLICYQVACFLKRAVLGAITSPESLVPRLRSADDGVTAETIDAQVAAQAIRIGLESCEKVNLDGEPLVYAGVMFLDACEASWFAKRTMLSFADRYIRTYPTGPHLAHVLACRMNFLLNSNVIDQKEIERLRSVLSNVSDPMARDALALCDFRASWTQYEMNSSEEQLQQSLAILGRMRDTSGVRMICVRAFIPKEMWPRLPFPLTGLTTD